jgi:hypothetical protein
MKFKIPKSKLDLELINSLFYVLKSQNSKPNLKQRSHNPMEGKVTPLLVNYISVRSEFDFILVVLVTYSQSIYGLLCHLCLS